MQAGVFSGNGFDLDAGYGKYTEHSIESDHIYMASH